MASNPRRSTMTKQHVIEQLEIRCNGKDFILRRLRECLDTLKAALAQKVFVRGTAEASSSSPATSSTSTPSSASPMATPNRTSYSHDARNYFGGVWGGFHRMLHALGKKGATMFAPFTRF
ncbi:MAG: hypothetical protein EOO65_03375 [Methanosarcinales archaeon]|nr:MAG: hypothetical protein EOO65_03375 [Methanosarcinales archaeon]